MVNNGTWRRAGICAVGGIVPHIAGYLAETYTGDSSTKDLIHLVQRGATFAVPYIIAEIGMNNQEDRPVKYSIEVLASVFGINSVLGNLGNMISDEYTKRHFIEWTHKNWAPISALAALIPGIKPFKREIERGRQNPRTGNPTP